MIHVEKLYIKNVLTYFYIKIQSYHWLLSVSNLLALVICKAIIVGKGGKVYIFSELSPLRIRMFQAIEDNYSVTN